MSPSEQTRMLELALALRYEGDLTLSLRLRAAFLEGELALVRKRLDESFGRTADLRSELINLASGTEQERH